MTKRYLYSGVELTDTSTRIRGAAASLTSRADGTFATGEAIVKDPTGVLSYELLKTFQVVEDACTPAPTLFTGSVTDYTVSRGEEYATGPGRVWTFQFVDLNGLMRERVFYASDAKRPRESGNARIAWLMASPRFAPLVKDHGQIGSLSDSFDAQDFRGQYAGDVLQSVMPSSIEEDAKTFFVYLDQASQQPSLYLHSPTATTFTSTIRISNVPGDYDGVTTFHAHPTPSVDMTGDDIYDGVYFTTSNGSIYRQRPATFATYGRHRDGTFSTDRIPLGDTAERHAQMWLDRHSGRIDTVHVITRLPPDKVGLIQSGHRLQIRLQGLPGYEAWTYSRVTAATLFINEGSLPWYDVQLELSTRGLFSAESSGGVGGTGSPVPPAGGGDVVQSVAGAPDGSGNTTLPAAPTVGNSLVTFAVGGGTTLPSGWTEHPAGPVGSSGSMAVKGRMFWRPVTGGDTAVIAVSPLGGTDWVNLWEVAGIIGTVQYDSRLVVTTGKPATITSGSILTTGPALILAGVMTSQHDWSGTGDQGFGDDAAWTHSGKHEITNPGYTTGNDTGTFSGAMGHASYKKVTAGGSYGPNVPLTGSAFNFGGWGGLMIAFAASADDATPKTLQWVFDEVPTPAPDGITKTFTTRWPYVPGTLRVRVDGVPILNGLTETNPNGSGGTGGVPGSLAFRTRPTIPALPAYLVPFTDPTWGTTGVRVTNVAGRRHAYARTSAWNCDGSKILEGFTFHGRMIDGNTYADLYDFPQISQAEWSNTDPNKLYGVGGNVFYRQDATTGTITPLHTFAGLATTTQSNGYDGISIGDGEGGISHGDARVALLGQTSGMGTQYLIVYNIATDTEEARITLSSRPNNAQISRLGNYVVTVGSNTRRYPADLSSSIVLNAFGNHGDNAMNEAGEEIYVTNNAPGVVSYRLSDGAATTLLDDTSAFKDGHTSGRALNRPGWIFLSSYNGTTMAGRPGFDQVVAVKTDGSGAVEVFGFVNHVDTATYADQPHAVPSRDGLRVLVASEWGSGTPGSVYDFVFSGASASGGGSTGGTFTLDFAPLGAAGGARAEIVLVDYQAQ